MWNLIVAAIFRQFSIANILHLEFLETRLFYFARVDKLISFGYSLLVTIKCLQSQLVELDGC